MSISYESLRMLRGEGLLVSEGDLWRRQRKLMQPLFTRQRLTEKLGVMTESVARLLDGWKARDGQAVDIIPEMMRLALDIVGRALMGADIADQMGEIERVLSDAVEYVYNRMQSPVKIPQKIPTPANLRYRRALGVLDRVVTAVIQNRRQAGAGGTDLLALLMQGRDDESVHGMSDRQLRDEVLTFLLAGHETTGDALCWTFYLLAQNPEADRRLHEEAAEVLRGRAPAAEDLPRLAYTTRVVSESMRLYPPAWAFTRGPIADDTIGGWHVPAKSVIVISPWVNHRLAAFWAEPKRFDPDRFTPERSDARPTYAYFPFGGGPHACIGMHLSMLEVTVATAMIAERTRLELVPNQTIWPEPRISLRPQPAMGMVVRAR